MGFIRCSILTRKDHLQAVSTLEAKDTRPARAKPGASAPQYSMTKTTWSTHSQLFYNKFLTIFRYPLPSSQPMYQNEKTSSQTFLPSLQGKHSSTSFLSAFTLEIISPPLT